MSRTALLIIDVQNDFLPPHGALAAPHGDRVLAPIKVLLDTSKSWDWKTVVASQDYHPPRHISFASTHGEEPFRTKVLKDYYGREYTQMLWPDHCVQGSKGAQIDKGLRDTFEPWKDRMKLVRKACHRCLEAYSAFEGYILDITEPKEPPTDEGETFPRDFHPKDWHLAQYLHNQGIQKVLVTGIATEYCVQSTAIASIQSGFDTALLDCAMEGNDPVEIDKVLKKFESLEGVILGKGKTESSAWEEEVKAWVK